MTRTFSISAGLFALALAAQLAPRPAVAETTFEIMPFVGGRVGGGFDAENSTTGDVTSVDVGNGASYGLDLGLRAYDQGLYELLYSSQSATLDSRNPTVDGVDVRIDYLHFGGTAFFPTDRVYVPYLSFTIGATFLEPDRGSYDSETKFSASLGGGFRFPINERMAVMLGVRGYLTLLESDTDLFCVSDSQQSGCLIRSSGSTLFQAEGQLGFSFGF